MLVTANHREELETKGYTIVRGALAPYEIGHLRLAVGRWIDAREGHRYLYNGIFKAQVFVPSEDDIFLPLIAHDRITSALRDISGGPLMFATEMGIAVNTAAGWHKDNHGLDPFDRHADADFGVYKVLIYPQDCLGIDQDDFAIKVRIGSHWMRRTEDGEEDTLFIRAGDAVIMDVRLTHRGHNDVVEGKSLATRALYSPLRRLAPAATYSAGSRVRRLFNRRERYLVTILYGKCNEHTTKYMRAGRTVTKKLWPEVITNARLPMHWVDRVAGSGMQYAHADE